MSSNTQNQQQFFRVSFSIIFQADKYKNEPPNALELFKEMHYSKKKGFAPAVQSLVVSTLILSSQPDDTLAPCHDH